MPSLADHAAASGITDAIPFAVARVRAGEIEALAGGVWPNGGPVRLNDRFYCASLAKQVTGVTAALLVREGRLDPDAPIGDWLHDLPGAVTGTTARQLAHHIGGLPAAGVLEATTTGDWTEAAALSALDAAVAPAAVRTGYVYSNVGYILLARLVAAVAEMPFVEFATQHLFAPAILTDIGFASDISQFAHAAMLGSRRPLSCGDGGLWSSASAFAGCLDLQNRDAWGTAEIVEAPGRLGGGEAVDYGWGIGLRLLRGHPAYLHAGAWNGSVARAIRVPALDLGIVAFAAAAPPDALTRLVSALAEADG